LETFGPAPDRPEFSFERTAMLRVSSETDEDLDVCWKKSVSIVMSNEVETSLNISGKQ